MPPSRGGENSRPLGTIKERTDLGLLANRCFSPELLIVLPQMHFKGEKKILHLGDLFKYPLFKTFLCVSYIATPSTLFSPIDPPRSRSGSASSERPSFQISPFSDFYYQFSTSRTLKRYGSHLQVSFSRKNLSKIDSLLSPRKILVCGTIPLDFLLPCSTLTTIPTHPRIPK